MNKQIKESELADLLDKLDKPYESKQELLEKARRSK